MTKIIKYTQPKIHTI